MNEELAELFTNIAIEKVYYPFGAITYNQSDLIDELFDYYHDGKLAALFEGKDIRIWNNEDMKEVFSDWTVFNEWIREENITGYFAVILTPVLTNMRFDEKGDMESASCSLGHCYSSLIYYESTEEILKQGKEIFDFWKNYDIEKAKAKKEEQQ